MPSAAAASSTPSKRSAILTRSKRSSACARAFRPRRPHSTGSESSSLADATSPSTSPGLTTRPASASRIVRAARFSRGSRPGRDGGRTDTRAPSTAPRARRHVRPATRAARPPMRGPRRAARTVGTEATSRFRSRSSARATPELVRRRRPRRRPRRGCPRSSDRRRASSASLCEPCFRPSVPEYSTTRLPTSPCSRAQALSRGSDGNSSRGAQFSISSVFAPGTPQRARIGRYAGEIATTASLRRATRPSIRRNGRATARPSTGGIRSWLSLSIARLSTSCSQNTNAMPDRAHRACAIAWARSGVFADTTTSGRVESISAARLRP